MTAAEERREVLRELLPELLDFLHNSIMAGREAFLSHPCKEEIKKDFDTVTGNRFRWRTMCKYDPHDPHQKFDLSRRVEYIELEVPGVMRIDLDLSVYVFSGDPPKERS